MVFESPSSESEKWMKGLILIPPSPIIFIQDFNPGDADG
jgi:uncharacterized membrane protein